MGNKNQKVTSVDFRPEEWKLIDRNKPEQGNKGEFKVLENTQSGDLLDQYHLFWPSEEDFRFYLDSYYWRKQQAHIVQSRYIVEDHNDQFCSRSYSAKVYIEHIPTRLSEVTDIPCPDNLYVAVATLEGYQKLYENLHYFRIEEDQICVDKEGVVKVWVNSDLSKNYPQDGTQGQQMMKDQSHMVEELMEMIWENTDQESEPFSFKQFYRKKKGKKRLGFDEAKVIVNQYAKAHAVPIPENFISILQMQEDSEAFENSQNQEPQEEGQYYLPPNQEGQNHQFQRPIPISVTGQPTHQMVNSPQQRSQVYQPQQGYYEQGHYEQRGANPDLQWLYGKRTQMMPGPSIPYSPVTQPIISIPPPRNNLGKFSPFQQSFYPNYYQVFNPQSNNISPGRLDNRVPFQSGRKAQHHQKSYERLERSNKALQEERGMSEGKKQGESEEHRYSQRPSQSGREGFFYEQNDAASHRQTNNQQPYNLYQANHSPVNRSLQFPRQPPYTSEQQERMRVNKSDINQVSYGQRQQRISLNHPFQEQSGFESYHNSKQSRHSHNYLIGSQNSAQRSNRGSVGYTGSTRQQEGNSMGQYHGEEEVKRGQQYDYRWGSRRSTELDTKYYTLEREIELDEQIAADLKKFITAA